LKSDKKGSSQLIKGLQIVVSNVKVLILVTLTIVLRALVSKTHRLKRPCQTDFNSQVKTEIWSEKQTNGFLLIHVKCWVHILCYWEKLQPAAAKLK